MVLPTGYPISAVAAERTALLLWLLMAYEAQRGRSVIEPGWDVGENAILMGRRERPAGLRGKVSWSCMLTAWLSYRPLAE